MGSEFRVNTYSDEWQQNPDVTLMADGSFIITWDSFHFNLDAYYVAEQHYAADGTPIGGETPIDFVTGSASQYPAIATLSDGAVAIAFVFSPGGILEPDQVFLKVYSADGSERLAATRVDTVAAFQNTKPDVVALGGGGFLVTFTSDGTGKNVAQNFDDIYAQRYDNQGNAIGGNFRLDINVNDFDQTNVSGIALANGNSLVFWHSEGTSPVPALFGRNEIRGTMFDGNGNQIRSDFLISIANGGIGDGVDPFDITPLKGGGFALVRYDTTIHPGNTFTYDAFVSIYSASGVRLGNETLVASKTKGIIYSLNIEQLTTGEIVVAWSTPASDDFLTYFRDVEARVLDSHGRIMTPVFQVAEDRTDDQDDPVIQALAGGNFVITYMSEAIDPSKEGVAARIFEHSIIGTTLPIISVPTLDDLLIGGPEANVFNGRAGSDTLDGGLGRDTLTGGKGADMFQFSSILNRATNVDKITDFKHHVDHIALASDIFAAVGFSLEKSEFRVGIKAKDANDYLIYDKAHGKLFYDDNGNLPGHKILFATLAPGTSLTFDDFLVV